MVAVVSGSSVPSRYQVLAATEGPGRHLFRVRDSVTHAECALIVVPAWSGSGSAFVEISRYFNALGRLDDPQVARVYDFGRHEGAVYYTRELGGERSIVDVLRESDAHTVLQILTGFAHALAALHESGLVHGLVIPAHLTAAAAGGRVGHVILADAGLSRLLPGRPAVPAAYLSPEVRAGADVSPASDLYGLGATLLEALGGARALKLLGGRARPFRAAARGMDREMLDLLDCIVAPDPARRPRGGADLLRMLEEPRLPLPERSLEVDQLVSSALVGREQATSRLAAALRSAAAGEIHAAEVLGAGGMGRSRLLEEVATAAAADGWTAVQVPADPSTDLSAMLRAIHLGLGVPGDLPPAPVLETSGSSAEEPAGLEPARWARFADQARRALDASARRLLLIADDADRMPPDLLGALRYLVTEVEGRPLLVIAAGARASGLPDAEVVRIGALTERDLRRYLAPLLTASVNPEAVFRAIQAAAAGNPLWVRLLLASWLESGRLRTTQGWLFLDDSAPAVVPASMSASIASVLSSLAAPERDAVELLAVWGMPLAKDLAETMLHSAVALPPLLAATDDAGMIRFTSSTFGPVIASGLPEERRRHWHEALLAALEHREAPPGTRAPHLLATGRVAAAVRDLVAGAKHAQAEGAYRRALEQSRAACIHLADSDLPATDQQELLLGTMRLATGLGDLRVAHEMLDKLGAREAAEIDDRLRFEILLARANVLRERHLAADAASLYARARDLAATVPSLGARLAELDFEEARNDSFGGTWEAGEARLRPLTERLRAEGQSVLLAAVLNRQAALRARAGDPRGAARLALEAGRMAQKMGDHRVAAAAFSNLGAFCSQLGQPWRALRALDQCRKHLAISPHEGLRAAELVHRGTILLGLGRHAEAEKAFLEARLVRLRSGDRGRVIPSLNELGRTARLQGHLERARRWHGDAEAIAAELDLPEVHTARANLGEAWMFAGELREAERLVRLGLAAIRPDRHGISLEDLGSILRRQGRSREALLVLADAETELARTLPQLAPLAAIESARVYLDLGDVSAAEQRIAAVEAAALSNEAEVRANYHAVHGRVLAGRHDAPYLAFDEALAAAKASGDALLLAETLLESLAAVLALPMPERGWIERRGQELEEVLAPTDARYLKLEAEALGRSVMLRFPVPTVGEQLADGVATTLKGSGGTLEVLLRDLVRQTTGARGAIVFAAGIDADGRLSFAPVPAAPPPPEAVVVRPYRVAVREFDRKVLREALTAAGGNTLEAARLLHIPLSTFRYRAVKAGILGGLRRKRSRKDS